MRASDVFMSFHLSNSMKENARHVQFNTSRVLARGFKWFRVDGIMAKINTKWLRSMRHVYCNAFNDHSASQKENESYRSRIGTHAFSIQCFGTEDSVVYL